MLSVPCVRVGLWDLHCALPQITLVYHKCFSRAWLLLVTGSGRCANAGTFSFIIKLLLVAKLKSHQTDWVNFGTHLVTSRLKPSSFNTKTASYNKGQGATVFAFWQSWFEAVCYNVCLNLIQSVSFIDSDGNVTLQMICTPIQILGTEK